jgi:hypothetical protein
MLWHMVVGKCQWQKEKEVIKVIEAKKNPEK